MSEALLGAVVGTLVILGAISLYIAIAYSEDLKAKFSLKLGSNVQVVRLGFGLLTLFLKLFLIAALALTYMKRKDINIINFFFAYGASTLFTILVLIISYSFSTKRVR